MRTVGRVQPTLDGGSPMKPLLFALALVLAFPVRAADHHDHGAPSGRPPETLGKVSFPTSCNPKVQAQFERGISLLHSFWFGEGLKAFTAVTEQDPGCGMAYW